MIYTDSQKTTIALRSLKKTRYFKVILIFCLCQVTIEMISTPKHFFCESNDIWNADSGVYTIEVLSGIVGAVCLTSFILCCRALIRGQLLSREVASFFEKNYNIKLTCNETTQFLNLWYVVICINDILIIIGTILKELIEVRTYSLLSKFASNFAMRKQKKSN